MVEGLLERLKSRRIPYGVMAPAFLTAALPDRGLAFQHPIQSPSEITVSTGKFAMPAGEFRHRWTHIALDELPQLPLVFIKMMRVMIDLTFEAWNPLRHGLGCLGSAFGSSQLEYG
jgi:hypothetical protein